MANGPSYLSAQLGSRLAEHGMTHTRGKPYRPMMQGKIERYHRSLKNQIPLENYYVYRLLGSASRARVCRPGLLSWSQTPQEVVAV